MIPKIIHYCWFGKGEKSKLAKKCIESWKKYCPDFKIIEWSEDNFDVNLIDYTRFTHKNKLYAYLSDYVRLWAIFNHGGIYFDTDVELIKPLDDLLVLNGYLGFESDEFINTGIGFGAEKNNPEILLMKSKYEDLSFEECEKKFQQYKCLTGSPKMNTYALTPCGLVQNGKKQQVNSIQIFPVEFFCPFNDITGEMKINDNTYSIHWYSKSAQGKIAYYKSIVARPIRRVLKRIGVRN